MGTPKRYRGVVRRGVVVLEPDAQLPEGTEVEVIECETTFQPDWEMAWRTVGIAERVGQARSMRRG